METINNNNNNGLNNNQPAPADAQPRVVRDYFLPVVNENLNGITNLVIAANNFESRHALINMMQHNFFCGLANEDPNIHLAIFMELKFLLSIKVATLAAQKNTSVVKNVAAASTSQGPEMNVEQAQYMANRPYNNNYKGDLMPNYYHSGLRNHENLSDEVEDPIEAKEETPEEKPTDKSMKKEDLPMYKLPILYP
uniref:Uncharacterized protein n=1 Tax=Cannabis sativa TaxID=3483 RepID=A0A803Q862_CANSA